MDDVVGAVPVIGAIGAENLYGTSGGIAEQSVSDQLPPMPTYIGELVLPCDGPHNLGAMISMIKCNLDDVSLSSGISETTRKISESESGMQILAGKWSKHGDFRRWCLNNLKFNEQIGQGSFGDVWKVGVNGGTEDEEYAVKHLSCEKNGSEIWKERDFCIYLKHKRVCNLVGAFYESSPFFVFELCQGSLAILDGAFSYQQKARFGVQLMQGVEWIHSKRIVHCDIRADNLLVKYPHNLVIADFGAAFLMPEGATRVQGTAHRGVRWCQDYDSNISFIYGFGSDVFSCACVLYELDTGARLFTGPTNQTAEEFALMYRNGVVGVSDTAHQKLSERVKRSMFGVILKEMVIDVPQRISAADFVNHQEVGRILQYHNMKIATLDGGTDVIRREYSSYPGAVFDPRTDLTLDNSVFGQKCLGMIYYDEKVSGCIDVAAPKPVNLDYVSLPKASVQVANVLVAEGLVADFVTALNNQETFALKVLTSMISDVFREPVVDVPTADTTGAAPVDGSSMINGRPVASTSGILASASTGMKTYTKGSQGVAPKAVTRAPNPVHVAGRSSIVRNLTKPQRAYSPQPPPKAGAGALVMTSTKASGYMHFAKPSGPVVKALLPHPSGGSKIPKVSRIIYDQDGEKMPPPASSFGARFSKTSLRLSHGSEIGSKKSKHGSNEEGRHTKASTVAEDNRRKKSVKEVRKRSHPSALSENSDSDFEDAIDDYRSASSTKGKKIMKGGRNAVGSDSENSDEATDVRRRKKSKKNKIPIIVENPKKNKVESSSDSEDEWAF